jgi:hypothetical protein
VGEPGGVDPGVTDGGRSRVEEMALVREPVVDTELAQHALVLSLDA